MSDAPEMPMGGDAPAPAPDPTMDQARALYDGLQNLDRRAETLGQVIRPGQDIPPDMTWDQVRSLAWSQHQQSLQAPAEPETDIFEQVYGEQQPAEYDPNWEQQQAPGFDPRTLAPVFDQFGQTVEDRAFQRAQQFFTEQLQGQAIANGVEKAASTHNLTDYDKQIVDHLTRQQISQQPNRAPADLANDVAKAYIDNINRRMVAQSGAPIQRPSAPGGPSPTEPRPTTEAEAIEWSRRALQPGI